jgi:hypothetical protein
MDIKGWKEMPVSITQTSFLKCCLYNAEEGMQDVIFWLTVNKMARVHRLQKMKLRLKDH